MNQVTHLRYLSLNPDGEHLSPFKIGGQVKEATAKIPLNTGDIVYISATGGVAGLSKSTTSTDYAGFFGVVVGGKQTYDSPVKGQKTGILAANAGESVLVQIDGIANVLSGGTITGGTTLSVVPDTTVAGRVIAGTTQGQMVGTPLYSAVVGGEVLILIDHR